MTRPFIDTDERAGEAASDHAPVIVDLSKRPHMCMLICMQSTSVRIDVATHDEIKRLAESLGTTVGHTVTLAVKSLAQERVGTQLAAQLTDEESAWLDAELG